MRSYLFTGARFLLVVATALTLAQTSTPASASVAEAAETAQLEAEALESYGEADGAAGDVGVMSWNCTVFGGDPPYRSSLGFVSATGAQSCIGNWQQHRACVQIQRRSWGIWRTVADSCGRWSQASYTTHTARWACSGTHTVRSRVRGQVITGSGSTATSAWYTSSSVQVTCS